MSAVQTSWKMRPAARVLPQLAAFISYKDGAGQSHGVMRMPTYLSGPPGASLGSGSTWGKKRGRASIGVITIKKGIPNLLRQPARSIVTTELTDGKKNSPYRASTSLPAYEGLSK
jgi:hypothetical protein